MSDTSKSELIEGMDDRAMPVTDLYRRKHKTDSKLIPSI
jgi:hypothetical protein